MISRIRSNLANLRAASLAWVRTHRKSTLLLGCTSGALLCGALVLSHAQVVSTFRAMNLAAFPLMAVSAGDKPTMALALSVEFPTVGAQYMPPGASRDNPPLRDESYSNTQEYIGYFDAESCYRYNNAPTETPLAGQTLQDYKRFVRTGPATNRMCADAFSGNFLNFALSSAIDILRMALSGGDRYIDLPTLTVLQRAVLPDDYEHGVVSCFFNSRNFPAKKLDRDGGNYFGAVPQSMIQRTNGKPIWVGNMLNRAYFGAMDQPTQESWCDGSASYRLGAGISYPTNGVGPAEPRSGDRASGTVNCANEGGSCGFPPGTYEVWYGNGQNWWVAYAKDYAPCNAATFGPVGGGASCFARLRSDVSWPPPPVPGLNSDGYFFARVEVCGTNSEGQLTDARDYGLCTQYPAGNFKPTGAIQKYSNDLRLAAFGYLLDQNAPWYSPQGSFGGVLRAPMKYVGAKTFNEFGIEQPGQNPNREWDMSNGVFVANPDAHALGTSGVINYLNKFGRTGPVKGRYKKFDPVGELHYEVVRYLQGRPAPTPAAIARLNETTRDGFPVYTQWTDPFGGNRSNTADYSCQKNSIVTIGDINTNDPAQDRFPPPSQANAIPDIVGWSGWRGIADSFERNTGLPYVDQSGGARSATRPVSEAYPENNNMSYAPLIGSAYWAASHDIRPSTWSEATKRRPGLRLTSYFFDVNEYGESSVNTQFRRNQNKFFTAAKYGGYRASAASGDIFNTWGNPFKREDGTPDHDVWQKSDSPGEARTYYLAENSRRVLRAFDEIFQQASTSARSIAGAAASSQELSGDGANIYQGAFKTEDFSGTVYSFPVTVGDGNSVSVSGSPTWSAAAQLDARSDPASTRNIVVGVPGATSLPHATNFAWAELTPEMRAHLSKSSPSATADGFGEARVQYLRGDRTAEGSTFRARGSLFGDVVNSGVVFSGAPAKNFSGEPSYASFANEHRARRMVYVGGNDGMLHALNATTGEEVFGYIPSWMGPKLSALTNRGYQKQAYVDATPVVSEAKVGGGWKTVLVGGTGAGGRGVYALDVTRPSSFSAGDVMWEFTPADDADIGNVIGQPKVAKFRTSAEGAAPEYEYFAVVASGVNNYVPEGGISSSTGRPALFLLSLNKRPGQAWVRGTNYFKISLPVDSSLAQNAPPGLVNFRPIYGAQQEVTAIYAGDLHGRVWKLNFKPHGKSDWDMNHLSQFNNGSASNPLPLFIAKDSSGRVQPITMAPSVAAGPIIAGRQTVYVAVGTGKYLEPLDRESLATNSFYVLHDDGTSDVHDPNRNSAVGGRDRLQLGHASPASGDVQVPAFTWGNGSDGTKAGYFFDMSPGERQVSNAVIRGDRLVFGSLNPTAAGATEPCAPGRGGNEYSLHIDSGDGRVRTSTVGLLGQPAVFDLVGDAVQYTRSDSTGKRFKTIISHVVQQGSGGFGGGDRIETTLEAGRLSFRSIPNYGELKRASE